jgi:hypothetical protein
MSKTLVIDKRGSHSSFCRFCHFHAGVLPAACLNLNGLAVPSTSHCYGLWCTCSSFTGGQLASRASSLLLPYSTSAIVHQDASFMTFIDFSLGFCKNSQNVESAKFAEDMMSIVQWTLRLGAMAVQAIPFRAFQPPLPRSTKVLCIAGILRTRQGCSLQLQIQ